MSVPVNPKSIVPIPDGYQPFPFEKAGCSTQELLQEAYERYADRIALEADGRKISYRELDRLTNQLANYILERMGDKEEPVAILVEQGLSQVIAVLAVLKAGKIYSVLDLVNPPEMLANMLADFGARLIVSNSNNSALARSIADQSVSIIEMDALKGNDGKIFVRRSPENLMAVYYTSGSIGRPKGVVYTHHSLNHFLITVINLYCMNPHDKQPLPFSCSFSWSVSPLFPTLLCGGTLYPVDLRRMNMLAFAAFVEEKRITILQVSSSLLRSFMGVLENTWRHFPHLRILLTGSETIQAEDIRIWQSLFSERTVLGCAFAMSEATLLSVNFVRYDSDIPQETISLGLPLPGKEILIVDEERHSLPQGEVGEIAIRSKYLPYGYWNKPEMTDAVYHADPNDPSKRIYYSNDLGRLLPNGQLEHLGRKDNIVKIRAYRVDLTEIEQAIYDLHSVRQAVVVAIPARHDPAQKQLVAYLVVKPFVPCDPSAFRKGLEEKLPAYMIPTFFVFLDALPLNINGKVDKKALPAVDFERALQEEDQPTDDVERRLTAIWQETFKIKQIGVKDNFFDVGGDSLLAVRLMLSIEEAFARKMPVAIISRASTIRQQAELLRNEIYFDPESIAISIRTDGDGKPLFCIGGKGGNPIRFHRLLRYLSSDQPVYFIRSRGFEAGEEIKATIEEIALDCLVEIRKIQPEGPYYFLGESSGGLVAYEMAQRLLRQSEKIALVGMLDTYLDEMKLGTSSNKLNPLLLARKHMQTLQSGGIQGLGAYIGYYVNLWKYKLNESKEARKMNEIRSRYSESSAVYDRVERANVAASIAYEPEPYDGRVVMFLASRQQMLEGGETDHGWKKVGIKKLIVHSIDCFHGNIMFEPFVQQIASILNQYFKAEDQ